jgi:membrane protease YdiL (CAAX protease family)
MKTVSRYPLILFFLLTILITWAVWVPAAIARLNGSDSILAPSSPLGGLARWSPGLVAILLTAVLGGKAGVRALFRPLLFWRVNILWYAFALFFVAGLFFVARGLDTFLGNTYQVRSPLVELYGTQAVMTLPVILLFAVPGALAEEMGWRGFAPLRLQERNEALLSSLVIGLVWGIWHIPSLVYFNRGSMQIALELLEPSRWRSCTPCCITIRRAACSWWCCSISGSRSRLMSCLVPGLATWTKSWCGSLRSW